MVKVACEADGPARADALCVERGESGSQLGRRRRLDCGQRVAVALERARGVALEARRAPLGGAPVGRGPSAVEPPHQVLHRVADVGLDALGCADALEVGGGVHGYSTSQQGEWEAAPRGRMPMRQSSHMMGSPIFVSHSAASRWVTTAMRWPLRSRPVSSAVVPWWA